MFASSLVFIVGNIAGHYTQRFRRTETGAIDRFNCSYSVSAMHYACHPARRKRFARSQNLGGECALREISRIECDEKIHIASLCTSTKWLISGVR